MVGDIAVKMPWNPLVFRNSFQLKYRSIPSATFFAISIDENNYIFKSVCVHGFQFIKDAKYVIFPNQVDIHHGLGTFFQVGEL